MKEKKQPIPTLFLLFTLYYIILRHFPAVMNGHQQYI